MTTRYHVLDWNLTVRVDRPYRVGVSVPRRTEVRVEVRDLLEQP